MDAQVDANQVSDEVLIRAVDDMLDPFLTTRALPESLSEAIRYALFGGGKRIRPLLCLRGCIAVGGDYNKAINAACAVEFIHTFSLVHDDLPAMDDDDLRRGRPTLHKHTNEAMAILAGDAMTALAFDILSSGDYDPIVSVKLTRKLAFATHGMINGQIYDTMGWADHPEWAPIDHLRRIHRFKTGELIKAALLMGAIVGHASEDQENTILVYADAIGLMFQAVDDLLDVTQSAEKMGKATGKDAEQGKLTYPGLLGVEGTRAEIEKLHQQAIDALEGFDAKADPLRALAGRLATRQH